MYNFIKKFFIYEKVTKQIKSEEMEEYKKKCNSDNYKIYAKPKINIDTNSIQNLSSEIYVPHDILKKYISQQFFDAHNKYGEIKIEYEVKRSEENKLSLALEITFNFHDKEFGIINIFKKIYETKIVFEAYKDISADNIIFNWFIHSNGIVTDKVNLDFNSNLLLKKLGIYQYRSLADAMHQQLSSEKLYHCMDFKNILAVMEEESHPNTALLSQVARNLTENISKIEAKINMEKERKLKLIKYDNIEKYQMMMDLFTIVFSPETKIPIINFSSMSKNKIIIALTGHREMIGKIALNYGENNYLSISDLYWSLKKVFEEKKLLCPMLLLTSSQGIQQKRSLEDRVSGVEQKIIHLAEQMKSDSEQTHSMLKQLLSRGQTGGDNKKYIKYKQKNMKL